MKLDPTSKFVQKKGWLPDDVDTPIGMYLSLYHVYHQQDKKDSKEDMKRELGQQDLVTMNEIRHFLHRNIHQVPMSLFVDTENNDSNW